MRLEGITPTHEMRYHLRTRRLAEEIEKFIEDWFRINSAGLFAVYNLHSHTLIKARSVLLMVNPHSVNWTETFCYGTQHLSA
jgi:hypothetical protein